MPKKEPKHYPLSSSGSSRWIACPGSIALEAKAPPDKDSPYAAEGTKAHAIGEDCLLKWVEPIDQLDAGPMEMLEAVQVYVDYINELAPQLEIALGDKYRGIEKKFRLGWIHKNLGGTNDAYVFDVEKKTLHVVDYKHGKGVVVEPEFNYQLMIYAIGALQEVSTLGYHVDNIEITIVQPRAYHIDGPIRSWGISSKDLMFWALNVLKIAAMNTDKKSAPLNAGDHCRFCKAKAFCPKLVEEAQALAKTEFANPVLPPPEELTSETILKVLNFSEVFKSWTKDVEAYVLHQMQMGQMQYPGHKLVRTTKHRRWVDPKQVEHYLKMAVGDECYNKKLVTPAQAEKVLKLKNISPEAILHGLWEKPEGELTVAPSSDKRKEIIIDLNVDFQSVNNEGDWNE
jgi:hypothetical protein